jgi:hypothetical protein
LPTKSTSSYRPGLQLGEMKLVGGNRITTMQRNRLRMKGRRESPSFIAIPHECLNHVNYSRLSPYAVKLLLDLYAQYRGINNGDFTAAWKYMKPRGWKSKDTLTKALKELLSTGWIVLSRQGGRNQCSLYAVTFRSIDSCGRKLDILETKTAPGNWKHIPDSLIHCDLPAGSMCPA